MAMSDQSAETRAEVFVNRLVDQDESEALQHVGENLSHFRENVTEWENGSFDIDSLPHFTGTNKRLMDFCIRFGLIFASKRAEVYVVCEDDNRFVSVYGHEENARARVEDDPELTIRTVTPQERDIEWIPNKFKDAPDETFHHAGENMLAFVDLFDALGDGDASPDDLPHLDTQTKWYMVYSILFGVLWEYSCPGLYAVLDLDNNFHGLYGYRGLADTEAEDDQYVQRVSVTDGEIGTDAVLEDVPWDETPD